MTTVLGPSMITRMVGRLGTAKAWAHAFRSMRRADFPAIVQIACADV